ncbi:MAG: AAA family ATPase [Nocardiaceae bacterium]|nr:AAA family ATPase [Nocardiaceae bacterium]
MTESSLPDYRKLFRATDLVPAAQPEWLAKGRIPRASICLLIGDEGIGKSLLWVLLVAHVTTGKPLFEFGIPAREPAHVILILTEDDWSTVVRPRLEVAGADLSMISVICTEDDGSGSPIFPTDMHLILDADPVPSLVVVDAWLDTVSSTLSVRDPQQARRALHPWKEAATETGATMLLLTHTNRTASANPRDKYGATGELRKKARMALYAQADDDEDGVLLVGPEKSNTTGKLPASRFRITPVQVFDATEDDDGTVPRLDLIGSSEKSIKEHIVDRFEAAQAESNGGEQSEIAEVVIGYLTDMGGTAPANDVLKMTRAAGLNDKTVKNARSKLGVHSKRIGFGKGSSWMWSIDLVVDPEGPAIDPHTSRLSDTGSMGINAGSMTQESTKGAQESTSQNTLPYAPLADPNWCSIHNEAIGKSGKCLACCLNQPAVNA